MAELLSFLVQGVLSGSVYGLVGVALSLVLVTTGTFDFAVGAYGVLAGVIAVELGGALGVVVGVAAAVLAALVIAAFHSYVVRARPSQDVLITAVASIGLGLALESLVQVVWGTAPFAVQLFQKDLQVGGIAIDPQYLLDFVVVILCASVLTAVVFRTGLGRIIRACAGSSRAAAEILGVRPVLTQTLVFLVSGGLAGLAGVMLAYSGGTSYSAGTNVALLGFAAGVVFGGRVPLLAVLGGASIGVIQSLASGYIGGAAAVTLPLVLVFVVVATGRAGRLVGGETQGVRA